VTAGEYTILASAYFRLLGDESIMTKTLESSITIDVHDATQQIPEFSLVATGMFGVGVVLSLMLLRRRSLASRVGSRF
jgi:hypothetical protein